MSTNEAKKKVFQRMSLCAHHRLFPEKPQYKKLTRAQLKSLWPDRAVKQSTLSNERGRLSTCFKVCHFLLPVNVVGRHIDNNTQFDPVSWGDVEKVLTHIAEHCVESNRHSMKQYRVVLLHFLQSKSTHPESNRSGSVEKVTSACNAYLDQGNPLSCRPIGYEDLSKLSGELRFLSLLWFYSGLRRQHFSVLEVGDLDCSIMSDLGPTESPTIRGDLELKMVVVSDKVKSMYGRHFSCRCGCYQSEVGTTKSDLCLLHDPVCRECLDTLLVKPAGTVVRPKEKLDQIQKDLHTTGHWAHISLAQSLCIVCDEACEDLPPGASCIYQMTRLNLVMGWVATSNTCERYNRTSSHYSKLITRLPVRAVIHNLLERCPSLQHCTTRGTVGCIPDIPYYMSESYNCGMARLRGLEEAIDSMNRGQNSMSAPGILVSPDDLKFLIGNAKKGLYHAREQKETKLSRIALDHENRDARKWKASIRRMSFSSSEEEKD
jgi:hypothetical protein